MPVTEHYISQLKNSGYSRKQAREVVICGMVGWLRKLERREKQGQGQYLAARLTLEERDEKKLLEKTSWYKENGKRKRENAESKIIYNPPKRARRGTLARKTGRGKTTTTNKQEQGKSKIKAVMFIPYTRHSELAVRIRENEERMEKMIGYRLKIVEKGGSKLVDLLHKANPWAGKDCERKDCLLCETKRYEKRENAQDCKKRNCVYKTYCITCNERQDKELEERL